MPADSLHPSSRSGSVLLNPVIKPALIAVFTAEALATNYAMIGLPNIKVMDALVFIAAFLFGWTVGTGIAISTWAIYGFINPYGQAGFPLIIFLMIGECFYAIGGVLLRNTSTAKHLLSGPRLSRLGMIPLFAIAGLVLTFAYDTLTNFASYMFLASSLYQAFLIGMITGAPFAIIHEASNFVFFGLVSPLAILTAQKLTLSRGGLSST